MTSVARLAARTVGSQRDVHYVVGRRILPLPLPPERAARHDGFLVEAFTFGVITEYCRWILYGLSLIHSAW